LVSSSTASVEVALIESAAHPAYPSKTAWAAATEPADPSNAAEATKAAKATDPPNSANASHPAQACLAESILRLSSRQSANAACRRTTA
jgi:hypothetical protein